MVSTRLHMVTAANPALPMLADVEHGGIRQPALENGVDGANLLTTRERQVLSLVAEGFSNKSIGTCLSISERTVKSHITNSMTKLWASDRTHAVVTAVRLGCLAL